MRVDRLELFAAHLEALREIPGQALYRATHNGREATYADAIAELAVCFPNDWDVATWGAPTSHTWVALMGKESGSPWTWVQEYFEIDFDTACHLFQGSSELGIYQKPERFGGEVIGQRASGRQFAALIRAFLAVAQGGCGL